MLGFDMVENKLKDLSFYNYLINEGYYFNKEIIENYLLSLKVKPFVILTGNSGTGKTKLSQLFAKYISSFGEFNDNSFEKFDFSNEIDKISEEYFTVKAKVNYSSWKNKGWTLGKDDFENILPIRECEKKFNMQVDGISAKGSISLGFQLFYESNAIQDFFKRLYDEDNSQSVDLKIDCESLYNFISDDYLEPNGSIIITQKSNKSAYNERQWMMNKDIFKYFPFYNGYFGCNIDVNGMKSKAKFRIVPKLSFGPNKELQDYLQINHGKIVDVELKIDKFDFEDFKPKFKFKNIEQIKNKDINNTFDDSITSNPTISKYKIVPVGANWTDNSNILGYFNAITEKYQSTPAYDLIYEASSDNYEPYFLILDEMNLSHVERYFADFLSAIESKEPIPLYGGEHLKLTLPNNLFIIGTVNVDETTYMFSPKVLDRANTIEFDTLSVSDYINLNLEDNDFEGDVNYLQSPLVDSDISDLNISDLKEILSGISCSDGNLLNVLTNELDSFQYALKSTGFDFGFRVINEILRFMVVAWRYENSPDNWVNWERYFDAQIKQKILPKLHGSQKAIGNVLDNLFNLCLVDWDNNEQAKLFDVTEDNSKYYTSALKLQSMSKVLSDQRYVSFIN